MNKFFSIVLNRVVYTVLFVAIQVAAFAAVFVFFRDKFAYFYAACVLLSALVGLHVLSGNSNPAYKIAWIIPILLFPVFGGLLYLMFGRVHQTRQEKALMSHIQEQYQRAMNETPHALEIMEHEDPHAFLHSRYIATATGCMPYRHTQTKYLPLGEDMLESMLIELEKAKSFIFMEYFIVEEGKMWGSLLEVLERKAAQGVDVRLMYDDFGCMFTLPRRYDKILEAKGIKTSVFNRFSNILNSRFNTRDHRKICVIDGIVGFTGGNNLADEYINAIVKHGHWKDTAIWMRGAAVWNLTVMFLSMWNYVRGEKEDFTPYAPNWSEVEKIQSDGYVQPYTDTPLDNEPVGEIVYMNLINRAREYVYITSPYLIIDNEMITAMRTAAQSGVDIRLITPHMGDKAFVHATTRSYYEVLLQAGVRVYEYTPGFIHAKTMVSDDSYGVVGTINLDFRSLYLHYECAAWLCDCTAVEEMRDDFLDTLAKSQEITLDSLERQSLSERFALSILRIFAPLM